ncbi:caspase family protein [Streptomyces sp. NBC_01808]|uniref:caspase, EACC1-associated type n=1 Tax=Streptomyces sp. NBC_01808 TaxID=2975947 RepID=UPI002DDA1D6D|nr:DnaJ C-terminal domain-containing protein [Streptomyces sp. NBC_01808]WSA38406.1 caspase family protein [Streptomyces sp. NBC_01808]
MAGPGSGSRDALLIATDTYDDGAFRPLRSPGQDCAGLARALADPAIGGFRAEQVKDAPAHQVMRAVERFFRDRSRDDLLLLHLSCHGIKDDDGHLHFAARDTDRDLPASTAMPAAFLRSQLERCRARTIVVLLDCCYSGAFLTGAKGDDQVHLREELAGSGRVVLTATSRTEYAWEGERLETASPQPSRFTGALIEGLTTGAADLDGDGRITVTELYDYVYESLHRAGARQRPRMWADVEYQVVIARVPPPQPAEEEPAPAVDDTNYREIMDAFFGGGGAAPPLGRTRRGTDATLRLDMDLADMARSTVEEFVVDTAVLCPTCSGGLAAEGTSMHLCAHCNGTGRTKGTRRNVLGWECRHCKGTGTLLPYPCQECGGGGRIRTRRTLKVKIPAGIMDGARIQLAGEGEVGPGGGPAADVHVHVTQRPHPDFTREGDDLHTRIALSAKDTAAGTTVRVPTLVDGDKTIRIPAGIRDGQSLRLRKLGMPRLKGRGRGDLFVHVDIDA